MKYMRNRCQLCGGKLVNNICTECGLDNSKNDSNYTTNKYQCQDEPLTHVHMNNDDAYAGKTMTKEQRQQIREERKAAKNERKASVQSPKVKKKHPILRIIKIILIVTILWNLAKGLFGFILTSINELRYDDDYSYEENYEYDPYQNEQSMIPEEGESFSMGISTGYYKGGIHLPEGVYTVELVDGDGAFTLYDSDNYISVYYSTSEFEDSTQEIRLHNGGIITVSGTAVFNATTENAQPLLAVAENENTESYKLSSGKSLTGGVDIPVGSYDVIAKNKYGNFDYQFVDEYDEIRSDSWYLNVDGEYDPSSFANLVIQDGMEISIPSESELVIELVPSLTVSTEGYDDYYYGL